MAGWKSETVIREDEDSEGSCRAEIGDGLGPAEGFPSRILAFPILRVRQSVVVGCHPVAVRRSAWVGPALTRAVYTNQAIPDKLIQPTSIPPYTITTRPRWPMEVAATRGKPA
jgi:hypothetical protein